MDCNANNTFMALPNGEIKPLIMTTEDEQFLIWNGKLYKIFQDNVNANCENSMQAIFETIRNSLHDNGYGSDGKLADVIDSVERYFSNN